MKKTTNFLQIAFFAMILIMVGTGCSEVDSAGNAHITFAQAWHAQWHQDTVYAIFSIVSLLMFAGYVYYIQTYKEWETGTIVIGMVLLALWTGIMFGMPITTMLNTTTAAAARGNYIL